MDNWKSKPMGFAIVDESKSGALLIHHVSVRNEGVKKTGLWKFDEPQPQDVNGRLAHWIVIGTKVGIEKTQQVLGEQFRSADLAGLVAACEETEETLNKTWQDHQDEEPKKRANLTPLAARTWPAISEDGDAAKILERVGKIPFPPSAPKEMRDILALANLVSYVIETWHDLETDRTSRDYLNDGDKERRLYPKSWAETCPPYWPKVT